MTVNGGFLVVLWMDVIIEVRDSLFYSGNVEDVFIVDITCSVFFWFYQT